MWFPLLTCFEVYLGRWMESVQEVTQRREKGTHKPPCQASPQFAPRWTHDRFASFLLMWISSLLAKSGNIPCHWTGWSAYWSAFSFPASAPPDLSSCTLPRLSRQQLWFLYQLADRGYLIQLCFGLQSLGDGLFWIGWIMPWFSLFSASSIFIKGFLCRKKSKSWKIFWGFQA